MCCRVFVLHAGRQTLCFGVLLNAQATIGPIHCNVEQTPALCFVTIVWAPEQASWITQTDYSESTGHPLLVPS